MITIKKKRTEKTYGLKTVSAHLDNPNTEENVLKLGIEGGKSNELHDEVITITSVDVRRLYAFINMPEIKKRFNIL